MCVQAIPAREAGELSDHEASTRYISTPFRGGAAEQLLRHDCSEVPLSAHGCYVEDSLQSAPESARHSLESVGEIAHRFSRSTQSRRC